MKYITIFMSNEPHLFTFPKVIDHDRFHESIRDSLYQLDMDNTVRRKTRSAGFVKAGSCSGESMTLNLSSNPEEDNKLLKEERKYLVFELEMQDKEKKEVIFTASKAIPYKVLIETAQRVRVGNTSNWRRAFYDKLPISGGVYLDKTCKDDSSSEFRSRTCSDSALF